MKKNEMLVAVRSGFLVEDDGELVEITRGQDRIGPHILEEREQYAEFFDPAVSVRGTDTNRSRYRGMGADGRMFSIDPSDLPRSRP